MTNNTLGFALLDNGNGFIVLNKSVEIAVPYGTFALTIINADFEAMKNSIADTIHLYFDESFNPYDTETFTTTLYNRVDYHISLSSKGYLQNEQSHMVTELLVTEILNRIEAEHFKISNVENCIPIVFSNLKIKNSIKDLLKHKSNDLTPIMQATGTFEIDSQLLYMKMPVYYLNTVSDYLLLDLKMYLEHSKKTVKECVLCKRLFLPRRKSDKYCRLPVRENRKTCNEIMHISPNDEFVKARNKARDKQHKTIRYHIDKGDYSNEFLLNLYDDWSTECGQKFKTFKSKHDLNGFEKWITKTRFTSDTIKTEWESHNNEQT